MHYGVGFAGSVLAALNSQFTDVEYFPSFAVPSWPGVVPAGKVTAKQSQCSFLAVWRSGW